MKNVSALELPKDERIYVDKLIEKFYDAMNDGNFIYFYNFSPDVASYDAVSFRRLANVILDMAIRMLHLINIYTTSKNFFRSGRSIFEQRRIWTLHSTVVSEP